MDRPNTIVMEIMQALDRNENAEARPIGLYVPFVDYQKRCAELEAENKRLREALEQYASKSNWLVDSYGDDEWQGKGRGWDVANTALTAPREG